VGFVLDEVALGRVFSEYFGFPCQSLAAVLSEPSWTPTPTKRIKKKTDSFTK
jgi:hypothetical protein